MGSLHSSFSFRLLVSTLAIAVTGCGGGVRSDLEVGPRCGDGRIDPGWGEDCDDGNVLDGDGCSSHCIGETGPSPRTFSTHLTCYLGNPSDPAGLLGDLTIDVTVDPVDAFVRGGALEFASWIEATIPASLSNLLLQLQLSSAGGPSTPILLDALSMRYALWVGGASGGPVTFSGLTLVDPDPWDGHAAAEMMFGEYDETTGDWAPRPVVIDTTPQRFELTNDGKEGMAFALADFAVTLTRVPIMDELVLDVTAPDAIPPDALVVCLLEEPLPPPIHFYGACFDGICGEGESPASCPADCPGTCGDGVVAGREQCDDGTATDSASCDADCSAPACADGILNTAAGELCEAGDTADCTDVDSLAWSAGVASCSSSCDGFDTSTCVPTGCGNGYVDLGESCDGDGVGHGGESAACDGDCTAPSCGDGHTNPLAGELCDGNAVPCSSVDPGLYAGAEASCNAGCDGWVTAACHFCGDGQLDAAEGELCDAPVDCSAVDAQYYPGDAAPCVASCTAFDVGGCRFCGDGTCDVADAETSVSCSEDCAASCGDGICDLATENAASCPSDCPQSCGDGFTTGTEVCDGNTAACSAVGSFYPGNTASCAGGCGGWVTSACRFCGDGMVDAGDGEACDGAAVTACANLGMGFTDGSASCAGCTWDISACATCGDGTCDPAEDASTCFEDCSCTLRYDFPSPSGSGSAFRIDPGSYAATENIGPGTMILRVAADAARHPVSGAVELLYYDMDMYYGPVSGVTTQTRVCLLKKDAMGRPIDPHLDFGGGYSYWTGTEPPEQSAIAACVDLDNDVAMARGSFTASASQAFVDFACYDPPPISSSYGFADADGTAPGCMTTYYSYGRIWCQLLGLCGLWLPPNVWLDRTEQYSQHFLNQVDGQADVGLQLTDGYAHLVMGDRSGGSPRAAWAHVPNEDTGWTGFALRGNQNAAGGTCVTP